MTDSKTLSGTRYGGGAYISDPEFSEYHRAQVVNAGVDTVAAFRLLDWNFQKCILVREKGAVYTYDPASMAADDGDTVIHDSTGARYLKGAFDGAATPGATGPAGGSFAYEFDAASQTMADPGPGIFRLNHATPASATAIALAADLVDASDVSALIVARLQSTSVIKARLVITTGANRLEFNVTAVTDNTAWLQLTIADGSIVGSVADESACELVFEETGDKGDQGLNISEQFAVALFDDTAINVGGYYVVRKAVADATISKVYAEIIGGTALSEADVYLEINGLPVYGPFTVTQGTSTEVTGLSLSVSQDEAVNWVVTSIPEGTVTELYLSATGEYV